MATQVQWRRGTNAQVLLFIGAVGEIVVNTTDWSLHTQDGTTAGGHKLALATGGTLTNTILAGTVTLSTVTLSGTAASTANITGGTYTSPALAGTPTTPTQSFADNSTQIVNATWVRNVIQIGSPINLSLAATQPMLNFNSPGT